MGICFSLFISNLGKPYQSYIVLGGEILSMDKNKPLKVGLWGCGWEDPVQTKIKNKK